MRLIVTESQYKKVLSEGRYEELLQKYPDFEDTIEYFSDNDPSPSKKYFPWMTKVFVETFETSDVNENDIVQMVEYFDKNIQKFEKKDIYQYTLDEFVKSYEDAITKISKRELVSSGVEKLYEDDKYLLIRPKNKEASCKYGANTKWCIASNVSNYFDNYKEDNLFFFIIDKLKQPIEGKKKSQNYFKIAIQYELSKPFWGDKDKFLNASRNGDFTFWNAIDDAVSKNTITKYIEKDIIKKFIGLIKDYTYKLYLNYYESQVKKQGEFDENLLEKLEREVRNKKSALTRAKTNYNRDKCVSFVEQTNYLYESFREYAKSIGIPKKSLDELLDFKGIKTKYYECLKTEKHLKSIVQQKANELSEVQKRYFEMSEKQDELFRTISFGNR